MSGRWRGFPMVPCVVGLASLVQLVAGQVPRATDGGTGRAVLRPATVEGVGGRVLRTEIETPEDPGEPGGRTLRLSVLVLAADAETGGAEPVFVFQGGPGQGATGLAAYYAEFFAGPRATRDIVLIDARGTGSSGALVAAVTPGNLLDDLGAVVPPSWVEPTLAKTMAAADPRMYTTRRIVADADRVRAALGYERINIYGTSYGSRVALVYMRHHPERVRAAIIKNVLPMRAVIPLSYAANAQRALDLLLAEVEADEQARAAYPDLRSRLDALLASLEASPLEVTVAHPDTGEPVRVSLRRAGVAMAIRNVLMSPEARATLPYLIERTAAGAPEELARIMVLQRVSYARGLAFGMAMSVIASEDCPRMTDGLVAADTAGSFLGDAALPGFRRVAEVWPHERPDPSFFEPVRCSAPTLLISGRLDPATPPAWGDEVARDLPDCLHVVFSNAAHPGAGFEGLDRLIAAFLERGSVTGLDTTGTQRIVPTRFKMPRAR